MRRTVGSAVGVFMLTVSMAIGGVHTWDVNEVFSNADGTIQFVELREAAGGAGETGVGGDPVSSDNTGNSFVIPSNVAPPTTNRHILLATADFAALPNAPTPDHIIPAGLVPFFDITGDTVRFSVYDAFTFGAVPTDGINSMNDGNIVATNTPTNYAGETGTVDASGGSTPGDFDGDGDIDDVDYRQFVDCHAGPEETPTPGTQGVTAQDCLNSFDRDDDQDVDTGDFKNFQTDFTGSL